MGMYVWWVNAGMCVPRHMCGSQELVTSSTVVTTSHHLETLRVFVFSLVCTSWEGGFSTVFSSPLPGPGSKYLDSKRLLFTPVSHLVGFAGNAREHEGLIALRFSFVSPVRRGALSIIAMALVSHRLLCNNPEIKITSGCPLTLWVWLIVSQPWFWGAGAWLLAEPRTLHMLSKHASLSNPNLRN